MIKINKGSFKKGHKVLKEIRRKISDGHKGMKKPWVSERLKGNIPWNKNKKNVYSKETLERMKKNNWMKGKTGDRCPLWKGGPKILYEQIRKHFKNRQWRSDVFERDNYTCQKCGKKGDWIESHHLKGFDKIIKENNIKTLKEALTCEELWNINNGITLCKKCHNKTRNRWGKSGNVA